MNNDGSQLPRRDFLMLAWQAMAVLAAVGTGFIGWRFLASRVRKGVIGEVIMAGALEDFPTGSVTLFTEGQFYLVRLSDGGLLALYRQCPHLGCVVLWNAREEQFNCPCHGSKFETNGALVNPPAPRPLVCFSVTVEKGIVRVDTSRRIERDKVSPNDAVYPPEETL